ncbi:protein kinase activator [Grosmannia clavigera kw1407]|uniref:Protein kinase activator n=1 Tax=Grosmannia clavigera (strain kw1407 / UAMH 11150) TaxID=655863 RepID=F0X8F9_GROCL|nr:protein kinase activator [Grosmannia clavigera kw1407]EFX05324.1 protein kinase activator [Grosmannia clavigera kw1407]
MKALRRSIKGEKEVKSHASITPKSAVAIVPPKKVIRALYDYEAQSSQELSFSRGDFFHVIGRENDQDWYEACNPALPDARGLVPVDFFQALGRTERDSAQSDRSGASSVKNPDHDSGYAEASSPSAMTNAIAPTSAGAQRDSRLGGKGNGVMVYGVVMYDFQAERADELEAKAGEAIIVIAQSNPEWFVAKPIGRLGGPGLIPVSFVEIRDMTSNTPVPDPQEAVRQAGIPKVEEWKKTAANYKNSSITLGKFEVSGGNGGSGQMPLEQGMERMSLQQGAAGGRASQNSYLFAPISAHIPRYCFAEDKYWFVIEAILEDGRQWELSRYYEDFYDFQIALLTEFPTEAGNTGNKKRTLPYMPGPVNYVTDAITEGRLHNLDAYVKNLLAQPPYIARCDLVKQFFSPRQGDYEIEMELDEEQVSPRSQPHPGDISFDRPPSQLDSGYSTGASAGRAQQPSMARQPSSLSQPSQSSLSPGVNQQPVQAMKVKLSYDNDLVAIRVPLDIPFRDLYDKIRDRLKISAADQMQLFYKDDATGDRPSMLSDNDLDTALQRNEKLTIYIETS